MAAGSFKEGIAAGRLAPHEYAANFADLHPPLDRHEALVESDRCYFCYDAPCMNACPTAIDIPLFIREIVTGNPIGAAKTIFDQNILGGMCARVCPTETLCEEACVRELAEGKPVQIGRLQRYATDAAMARTSSSMHARRADRQEDRGRRRRAGRPRCAHRLARHGHDVTIFEARPKAGGLNEYGIAAYKSVDDFAQAEVDYVTAIGGIAIENGKALGRDVSLADLTSGYDAVFLGMGLAGVNALARRRRGRRPASTTRSSSSPCFDRLRILAALPVGRRVVVIGGGMTAIDAAVQSKLLGAEEVTICYRRGQENMNASGFEQDLASANGVSIRHWLQPKRVIVGGRQGERDRARIHRALRRPAGRHRRDDRRCRPTRCSRRSARRWFRPRSMAAARGSRWRSGRIKVDVEGRTSMAKVWAGGDCILGGDDLTVSAVAQGRDAAESIHRALMG